MKTLHDYEGDPHEDDKSGDPAWEYAGHNPTRKERLDNAWNPNWKKSIPKESETNEN